MLDKILSFIADRLGVDWIVERVETDSYKYKKYASGDIKLAIKVRLANNNVSATGSAYYSKHGYDLPTSITLTSIDNIQGELRSDWIGGITIDPKTTLSKIQFYCWTSRSSSRSGFDVYLEVEGKYK